MNEIKKNLKLFTLLAALFAGNVAFAPAEGDFSTFHEEPIHEDPIVTREREAREQEMREQQARDLEQKTTTKESLGDRARRALRQASEAGIKVKSTVTGLFKTPEPVRRSTEEPVESGKELLSPDEAAAPDKDFVMVEHEPAARGVSDLTTEEVEKLTPEDVSKYTQQDIKDLSFDIANLSPEAFDSLSAAQTVAMTADQLISILSNPEFASKLKIESVNPTELSKVFNFRNSGGKIPDEIVNRMTKDQINKILENNPSKLSEYFSNDQIARMKSKVSLKDQLSTAAKKAVSWLNSTTVVKWFNDFGNRNRSKQEASRMARSAKGGTLDESQRAEFKSHMDTLSTKGKEEVANAWATTRITKVRDIEEKIEAAKKSKLPSNERIKQIDALRKELTTETQLMDSEMGAFGRELQRTLKPTEVVIPLEGRFKKELFKAGKTGDRVFEIVDMTKIDPTKSISGQYTDLTDTGFFGTKDPAVSNISPNDLLQTYGSWVAKGLTIDPTKPIADQLDAEVKKATGKQWSELDPSVKVAIFVKLDADIQDRFEQDVQDKNAASAARAKKEFEATILIMTPDAISELSIETLKELDPATITQFSKEQIQALTLDQIEALSPEQIKALDFTQLKPITIRYLIDTMSPEKIATLTPEQLQGLPKGKLGAILAKQSVADLQTIEAAFKAAGSPFEASVTREIARKTTAGSYKGDFDIHRIAIHNSRALNTRAEDMGSLSLDVVADLDSETVAKMSDDQVNAFTKEQLNVLGKDAINAVTPRLAPAGIADLSAAEFSKLTATTIEELTPEQTEVVTKPQLEKLNVQKRDAAAKAIEKYSIAKAKSLGLDLGDDTGLGGGRRGKAKPQGKRK